MQVIFLPFKIIKDSFQASKFNLILKNLLNFEIKKKLLISI